jgi:hypothetical protein
MMANSEVLLVPPILAAKPRIPVLSYHQVGKFPDMTELRAGYRDVDRFRTHLAWPKCTGYQIASLREAFDALFHGFLQQGHSVVLTFDDGYPAAVTCSRGAAKPVPNAYEIPRMAISCGDSLAGFAWKLTLKNRRRDRYA